MFFREALLRCSKLQRETAGLFDELCAEAPSGDPRVPLWKLAAATERRRAGILEALAALCVVLEDEGPFLVQIPLQLEAYRAALERASWRREACSDHPRCLCAEAVEAVLRPGLHADLLEVAEPELKRALRSVSGEIRNLRRSDAASRRAPERVAG